MINASLFFTLWFEITIFVSLDLRYSFSKHQTITGHRDEMTMYSNIDHNAKLGGDSLTEKDILRVNRKYGCEVKSSTTTTAVPDSMTTASSNGNLTTSNNDMISTTVSSSNMTTAQGSGSSMTTQASNSATTKANDASVTQGNSNDQTTTSTTVQQSTMDLGNFTTPPAVNGTNTSLWGSTGAHQTSSHPITFVALFMGSIAVLSSFV